MRLHSDTLSPSAAAAPPGFRLARAQGTAETVDHRVQADEVTIAQDPELAVSLKALLATLSGGQALQHTPQRIVLTGVQAGSEGSMLASNLALTCADEGYRVLLVDANLSAPMVAQNLGLSNHAGLSNLLSEAGSPNALVQATAHPNLAAITIGPACLNLASLLNRVPLFHRLEPLARRYDYMVVDCGSVPSSLVGRVCVGADKVVVAVKEHVSSMRELTTTVEALRGDGGCDPVILMVE